jgi:hypothetical protein
MYTTLIVGGGVAGLSVARELARRGDKVLLLDKWGNWGGRVWTHHEKGFQYEVGAGRIFKGHARVTALVKHYKLRTFPITTASTWEVRDPNMFQALFAPIRAILKDLPETTLATTTISELLPPAMHPILRRFPYRSEFYTLRADEALKFFSPRETMGAQAPDDYYGVVGGLEQIPHGLAREAIAAGATLKQKTKVTDIQRNKDGFFTVTAVKDDKPSVYTAARVVLATCRCSLSEFSLLGGHPVLKQTGTAPLTRIYAVYPPDPVSGLAWFEGLEKVVTDNPLRYVIPINAKIGLIMISYTDGEDTEHWHGLKGDALKDEIQRCAKELFPTLDIPEPTYLQQHRWDGGCTYWLPGDYKVADAIKAAMNPAPNLYIAGESISPEQCWIESALESAETLLALL